MAKLEPVFTVTDANIFLNLHKSALEQAKKKAQKTKQIINTMVSPDGKNMGGNSENTYEFGVTYEIKEYKDTNKEKLTGDDATRQAEKNKEAEESYKKNAYDVIFEYFKWFSGEDVAKNIKESSIRKFYPNQRMDATIKDYKIEGMEYEKAVEEMKDRPILGYKITFSVDPNAESETKE